MSRRILTFVGARPQFIKASVVSKALKQRADLTETIIHSGQHYDASMSAVFFDELGIPQPAENLEVGSGSHGDQTARLLREIEGVMLRHRPDGVLVYGDTNTTLAAALSASKLRIPLFHVEAGLRGYDRAVPEEVNRIVTDVLSDVLFAPTKLAEKNLLSEGIGRDRIELSGDITFDAALHFRDRARSSSTVRRRLGLKDQPYVVVTIHRAENTESEQQLGLIMEGLAEVSKVLPVVFPLHPRTSAALRGGAPVLSRLHVIDPVGYLEMLDLLSHATAIATDSGGVQREAFFFRVPCTVIRAKERAVAEWQELVDLGWNRVLVPRSSSALATEILGSVGRQGTEESPFGDGRAADRIVARIAAELNR